MLWPTGKFGLTAVGHESTMREGMISQLAKATGVKLDAQTVVVGYEHRMDGLRVALEHIAHDNPHLLVVVIPTNIEPTIVSTELANRCTHVGKGIMPLLVFNTHDLHDMHLRGVWRNFIAELRKTAPALPLIDLSEPFECITKYSKGTLETVPNHAFESGISEFIDRIKWQLDSRSTPSHPSHP